MNRWYSIVRLVVSWILHRYFKTIKIVGVDNIPKTGPVLFTVNHQNAFLDALLVATTNKRELHFLARADVFKSSWARGFFQSLNMMPIYRWRDGRQALGANHAIFSKSHNLLNQHKALLMFPEANHHQKRLLLPLSKGFTRITSGIDDPSLSIIPVGLNYTHHRHFGGSVSVYYGAPIKAGPQSHTLELKAEVAEAMQQLITHIPDDEHYQQRQSHLDQDPYQYLDPDLCNQLIRNQPLSTTSSKNESSLNRKLSKGVSFIFNLPPLLLNYLLLNKIGDPVFSSSIKVISGLILFPIYYTGLLLLIWGYSNLWWGAGFVATAILTMYWRKYSLS